VSLRLPASTRRGAGSSGPNSASLCSAWTEPSPVEVVIEPGPMVARYASVVAGKPAKPVDVHQTCQKLTAGCQDGHLSRARAGHLHQSPPERRVLADRKRGRHDFGDPLVDAPLGYFQVRAERPKRGTMNVDIPYHADDLVGFVDDEQKREVLFRKKRSEGVEGDVDVHRADGSGHDGSHRDVGIPEGKIFGHDGRVRAPNDLRSAPDRPLGRRCIPHDLDTVRARLADLERDGFVIGRTEDPKSQGARPITPQDLLHDNGSFDLPGLSRSGASPGRHWPAISRFMRLIQASTGPRAVTARNVRRSPFCGRRSRRARTLCTHARRSCVSMFREGTGPRQGDVPRMRSAARKYWRTYAANCPSVG
jgi:hypothetical protein